MIERATFLLCNCSLFCIKCFQFWNFLETEFFYRIEKHNKGTFENVIKSGLALS